MKREYGAFIVLSMLFCAEVFLLFLAGDVKTTSVHREASVFSNALFIGDSLTEGAYWYYDEAGERCCCCTEKNIPYFFRQISGADEQNAGYSGIDAETWYKEKRLDTYSDYDLIIIWLGTNDGYSVEQFAHGVQPIADYEDYSDDPTGYYCRIIASIKESNPRAHVVLCTIFAGGNFNGDFSLESTNKAIKVIAEYYGCQLCDMTWLALKEDSEYHAEIDNIHLGVYGNLRAAEHLYNEISKAVREDYAIAEGMYTCQKTE